MTPITLSKPWHCSSEAFAQIGAALQGQKNQGYDIVDASPDETQRIFQWYQHHPVPGLTLKKVEVIHNPQMARLFEGRIALLEKRHKSPAFKPNWANESATAAEKKQREEALALLEKKAEPYKDLSYPHVTIVPLWHGTKKEILHSLFETGFANLATTDDGFFGKGIYSAGEAEYAYRVYSQGALLINWVAVYSVFPVLRDDMDQLRGKGNYQNYDGHFAPVVPKDPQNPHEVNYYPCKAGEKHLYTELVVFESSQVLPRYLVELQPELPASPPGMGQSSAPISSFNVGEMLTVLLEILDDPQVQNHPTLRPYLDHKVETLLELDESTPLEAEEAKLFKLAKRLLTQGKVNKAVLNLILKTISAPVSTASTPMIQPALTVQTLQEKGPDVPISPASSLLPKNIISPSPSPLVMQSSTHQAQKTPASWNPPPLSVSSPVSSSNLVAPVSLSPASQIVVPSLPSIAFGAAKWNQYFGDVGVEPPLPSNIDEILSSPCPFWPDKKVQETHLLVLVPQTVNGKPLTLRSLGELVKKPKQGNAAKYEYFDLGEYTDPPAPASYWVLMTRDVLKGSRNKSYTDQQALVASYAQKTGIPYEVPHVLDAAVCIFMEYVQSGTRLYGQNPWTFTHCQEKYNSNRKWQLSVGGFSAAGLGVDYCYVYDLVGVGCSRKF